MKGLSLGIWPSSRESLYLAACGGMIVVISAMFPFLAVALSGLADRFTRLRFYTSRLREEESPWLY
jgi:hypothetical protein